MNLLTFEEAYHLCKAALDAGVTRKQLDDVFLTLHKQGVVDNELASDINECIHGYGYPDLGPNSGQTSS